MNVLKLKCVHTRTYMRVMPSVISKVFLFHRGTAEEKGRCLSRQNNGITAARSGARLEQALRLRQSTNEEHHASRTRKEERESEMGGRSDEIE